MHDNKKLNTLSTKIKFEFKNPHSPLRHHELHDNKKEAQHTKHQNQNQIQIKNSSPLVD